MNIEEIAIKYTREEFKDDWEVWNHADFIKEMDKKVWYVEG